MIILVIKNSRHVLYIINITQSSVTQLVDRCYQHHIHGFDPHAVDQMYVQV